MRFANDKEAFDNDRKEQITYQQKIARAKSELKNRLPARAFKRKELWEQNKTKWQIMKINAGVTWRQFDLKSRGMGFFLLCLMGMMIISMAIPYVIDGISTQLDKTKYSEALKTSCLNEQFYAWNFKACENISIRPYADTTPQEPVLPKGEQA